MTGCYVKGMKLPESCSLCLLCRSVEGKSNRCLVSMQKVLITARPADCPLVEVDDPTKPVILDPVEIE